MYVRARASDYVHYLFSEMSEIMLLLYSTCVNEYAVLIDWVVVVRRTECVCVCGVHLIFDVLCVRIDDNNSQW